MMQFTSVFISLFRLLKKLLDIIEYDKDRDKLDVWKQIFKQKMHIDHDRYFIDVLKIFYVEFRLIIKKKLIFLWVFIESTIFALFLFLSRIFALFEMSAKIFSKLKTLAFIFAIFLNKTKWFFSSIILFLWSRKNALT